MNKIKVLHHYDGRAESCAVTAGKDISDFSEAQKKEYVNRIVNVNHHESVNEFEIWHLEFSGISKYAAMRIGERRFISILEKSFRRKQNPVDVLGFNSHPGYELYYMALDAGVSAEDARQELPISVGTTLHVMCNTRQLVNIAKKLGRVYNCDIKKEFNSECRNLARELASLIDMIIDPTIFDKSELDRESEFHGDPLEAELSISSFCQLQRHRSLLLDADWTSLDSCHNGIPVMGDKIGFWLEYNDRSLAALKALRLTPHAQREIRNFVEGLE